MERTGELVGKVGFSSMVIRPGDTSVAMGLGDLPVVAPAHLLSLLESAVIVALSEYLELGESTRLASLELELLGAAAIGAQIRAAVTCSAVSEKEITFTCDIYHGERPIARAQMKRATVERVSFLARTAAQNL